MGSCGINESTWGILIYISFQFYTFCIMYKLKLSLTLITNYYYNKNIILAVSITNKIAAFIKIVVFIHVFNILIISFFFLRPRILRGLIYLPLQIYILVNYLFIKI